MRRPVAVSGTTQLVSILERFEDAEVVVAGDFMVDEYIFGETDRISREAPVLIVRFEHADMKPGGAGNAAQNVAALGVRVRAVGAVGDDTPGNTLLELLASSRVDVSGIQRVRGRRTESKTRILAGGRSTRRQQMLRVDRAPAEALAPAVEARIVRELSRAARGAGAVLASDYGSGALGPAGAQASRPATRVPSHHRRIRCMALALLSGMALALVSARRCRPSLPPAWCSLSPTRACSWRSTTDACRSSRR